MDVYEKLAALDIKLGPGPEPTGLYRPATFMDKLVYTAGIGCRKNGKPIYTGKVGKEVTLEQAHECARLCAINILCNLQTVLGDLNRVKKIVKVLGFIACADGFYEQPKVLNGASEFFQEIWGENGVSARSAIGVYSLPSNMPVEVEVIFELYN